MAKTESAETIGAPSRKIANRRTRRLEIPSDVGENRVAAGFADVPSVQPTVSLVLCKISRTIQESLTLEIRPVPLPKIN